MRRLVRVVYPNQAATSLGAVDQMTPGAGATAAAASDTAVSSSDRLPAWSRRFGFSRRRRYDKVLVEDFVRRNDELPRCFAIIVNVNNYVRAAVGFGEDS